MKISNGNREPVPVETHSKQSSPCTPQRNPINLFKSVYAFLTIAHAKPYRQTEASLQLENSINEHGEQTEMVPCNLISQRKILAVLVAIKKLAKIPEMLHI